MFQTYTDLDTRVQVRVRVGFGTKQYTSNTRLPNACMRLYCALIKHDEN